MCIRALRGYFTCVMSLNPLWEEMTPQCASSKWKGTHSQCYSSPTVWVAKLGTAVVDLLCVARSYRLSYRKDQEAYTERWKGQLLWRFGRDPIRRSSDVTSPFPPSGNEGYIRNRDISLTVAFSSSALFGLGLSSST